jgi:hypothetical protein
VRGYSGLRRFPEMSGSDHRWRITVVALIRFEKCLYGLVDMVRIEQPSEPLVEDPKYACFGDAQQTGWSLPPG